MRPAGSSWLWAVVVATCATGCLQPVESIPDAGEDAGIGDAGQLPDGNDGGIDAGIDDGGAPDAGGSEAGPVDAGMPDAAVGPVTWGLMTGTFPSELNAVSASSRSNAYVVDRHGAVHRYDGAGWKKVTQSPNNFAGEGIHVAPDGAVFVGGGDLAHCLTNCSAPEHFTWSNSPVQVRGVCGRDANSVFATGTVGTTNDGALLKFDVVNRTWVNLGQTGSFFNEACWVSPTGAVFIAAQASIVRFENGVLTPETIHFPDGMSQSDISFQRFQTIGGSGDAIFAAGYRRGTVRRNAQGSWDYVIPPVGVDRYDGVAATGAQDVFLVGPRSGDGSHVRQFDGTSWFVPMALPNADLSGIHAVDSRTWFAVGSVSISSGVVFMGARP